MLLIKAAFLKTMPKLFRCSRASVTKSPERVSSMNSIPICFLFFFKLSKIRQTSNNGDQHCMYFIEICFVHIYYDASRARLQN